MRAQSIQQFAIVQADSAAQFEEKLNARMAELSNCNPQVRFDGLTAYISYDKVVKIPECLADQYELEDVRFHCEDCPEFHAFLKEDGTEDRRRKYGECQYAKFKRAYRDSDACDVLFQLIKEGRIGLCYRR